MECQTHFQASNSDLGSSRLYFITLLLSLINVCNGIHISMYKHIYLYICKYILRLPLGNRQAAKSTSAIICFILILTKFFSFTNTWKINKFSLFCNRITKPKVYTRRQFNLNWLKLLLELWSELALVCVFSFQITNMCTSLHTYCIYMYICMSMLTFWFICIYIYLISLFHARMPYVF